MSKTPSPLFRRALLALALAAPLAAHAAVLAEVDGHAITAQQVEAGNPAAAGNAQVRTEVLQNLIAQQLLADTAAQPTAAQDAQIAAGQANLRRQALAQLATNAYMAAHPVDDAELHQRYALEIAALPQHEYWVRWIITAKPEQATQVLDAIRRGESFTRLSIERSIARNAALGGALGWQTERELPAAVLGAVEHIKPGEVTGPLALDSGYAVVQLIAQRAVVKPSFEQLRAQLEQQLRNATLQAHVQELAKRAKIVRHDLDAK